VPLLRERLMGAIHGRALDLLDIDLTGVKFLDCAGIGALVGVYNVAVQSGRRVQLQHPQPFVRRVLDLARRPGRLHRGPERIRIERPGDRGERAGLMERKSPLDGVLLA
jgi:ABC-type transporter Mla MlaB component